MYKTYQLSERQRRIVHGALIYGELFLDDLGNIKGVDPMTEEEIKAMLATFGTPITEPEELEPLWKRDPFTDADRINMRDLMEDEIRDCVKEKAEEALDDITDPCELLSYADEDPQQTARFLQLVEDENDDLEGVEQPTLDFAYRFDLVTTVPTSTCGDGFTYALTELGRKYLTDYK